MEIVGFPIHPGVRADDDVYVSAMIKGVPAGVPVFDGQNRGVFRLAGSVWFIGQERTTISAARTMFCAATQKEKGDTESVRVGK